MDDHLRYYLIYAETRKKAWMSIISKVDKNTRFLAQNMHLSHWTE